LTILFVDVGNHDASSLPAKRSRHLSADHRRSAGYDRNFIFQTFHQDSCAGVLREPQPYHAADQAQKVSAGMIGCILSKSKIAGLGASNASKMRRSPTAFREANP